jgi:multidrug efflux pump subunit AcrB
VEQLVVAVRQNRPVYLHDVASVTDGSAIPGQYVWHGVTNNGAAGAEYPAITMSVTKKPDRMQWKLPAPSKRGWNCCAIPYCPPVWN